MIQMINESLLSVITGILFMYMLYIVRKANKKKRKGQEHAQGLVKE